MGRRIMAGGQASIPGLRATAPASRQLRPSGGQSLRMRTPRYRALIQQLDAGQVRDHGALQQLIEEIKAELGELSLPVAPVGLVGECFLGPPYRVHTLDLVGEIVEHYEAGRSMPDPYERARSLALHPDYVLVEVYPEHLVALRADGTAVTV